MKTFSNVIRTVVGFVLCWFALAPVFFFLMFAWFTPKYYLIRAIAKARGTYGTEEFEKQITAWHAEYSRVTLWLFEHIIFLKVDIRTDSGLEIIPGASYLAFSNHVSWFDAVYFPGVLYRIGLRHVRYPVKEDFLEHWPARFVLTMSWLEAGFPFVKRPKPNDPPEVKRAKAEEAVERIERATRVALSQGGSMLTFCEGTRPGPEVLIGEPRSRGFIAQEKILVGRPLVGLTQCPERPVGRTILSAHTYFRQRIIFRVQVYKPLPAHVDRDTWLKERYAEMGRQVGAVRQGSNQ